MAAKGSQEEDGARMAMARLLSFHQLEQPHQHVLQLQEQRLQIQQHHQQDEKASLMKQDGGEFGARIPGEEQVRNGVVDHQEKLGAAGKEQGGGRNVGGEVKEGESSLAMGVSGGSGVLEQARPLAFRLASPSSSSAALVTPICTRGQVYPPPLATHEEVIRDPTLFMDTLSKFHEAMGSRMTTPRMGGSQLDLYRLYTEVTSRGGLELVIRERLWKDIKAVFNFPKTTTSASFVLRKYYLSLLHHYEQVYFFRVQGPLVPPPPTTVPIPSPAAFSTPDNGVHSDGGPRIQRRRIQQPVEIDPSVHVGKLVTGSIEEKFEHGYLVTVDIGSERLRGVLYHAPVGTSLPQTTPARNPVPDASDVSNMGVRLRRRRRRLGLRKKDPNAPKLNRSGYNFFFAEQRAKLKHIYPDKDREISKMIGETWSNMTEAQKSPYQERGMKDKERYKQEMSDYRERLKNPRPVVAAAPCEVDATVSRTSENHDSYQLRLTSPEAERTVAGAASSSLQQQQLQQEP